MPPISTAATVHILTEKDLRRCVALDRRTVDVIESAFSALAEKAVDMPPIQHISVAEPESNTTSGGHLGDVDIKSAFIPGLPYLAVKIATGFFGNAALGLPSGSGLMVLLDTRTGRCGAVLLDNGYLTDVRTAAAGAVAARYLAPPVEATGDSGYTVGVLGTGRQAELQMRALHLVRPFERLLIHGRNPSHARHLASLLAPQLGGIDIRVVADIGEVVRSSRVVTTTTASTEPLITADMLPDGPLHITAMGSDLPGKQELDPAILLRADLCVFDRRSQCARLGELQHVPEARRHELLSCELGELTSGLRAGRAADHKLTVCDLTGTGAQDTAVAVHALTLARTAGLGSLP